MLHFDWKKMYVFIWKFRLKAPPSLTMGTLSATLFHDTATLTRKVFDTNFGDFIGLLLDKLTWQRHDRQRKKKIKKAHPQNNFKATAQVAHLLLAAYAQSHPKPIAKEPLLPRFIRLTVCWKLCSNSEKKTKIVFILLTKIVNELNVKRTYRRETPKT
jgi:hypothetical protein